MYPILSPPHLTPPHQSHPTNHIPAPARPNPTHPISSRTTQDTIILPTSAATDDVCSALQCDGFSFEEVMFTMSYWYSIQELYSKKHAQVVRTSWSVSCKRPHRYTEDTCMIIQMAMPLGQCFAFRWTCPLWHSDCDLAKYPCVTALCVSSFCYCYSTTPLLVHGLISHFAADVLSNHDAESAFVRLPHISQPRKVRDGNPPL